jgi:hypothetical protein
MTSDMDGGSRRRARTSTSWFLCGRRAPTVRTNCPGRRYRARSAETAPADTLANDWASTPFGTMVKCEADGYCRRTSARLAHVGAVVAAARRRTIRVATRKPSWRCRPPAKTVSLSIMQSWTVTTMGHGSKSGVSSG